MTDDEQQLMFERVLVALESLATRNASMAANLEQARRIQEADALRTTRLEESMIVMSQGVGVLAGVVSKTQTQVGDTHTLIQELTAATKGTDERINNLVALVEHFIRIRGNGGNGQS